MSVYLSAILIGLLHGVEPGHGWPVAVVYSLQRERRAWFGLLTSSILAFFHLLSSLAVVLVFLLVNRVVDLSSLPIVRYSVVALLLYMAYRAYTEPHKHTHGNHHDHHGHPHSHGHEHAHVHHRKTPQSLRDMAVFAFLLGFIHEEEFALLALCLGGIHCVALMLTYALAVSVAIIGVTLLAIQGYHLLEERLRRYDEYIPKALAGLFILMAILYLFRAL
ncbi:MAG: nickel/cobalt transporter [candidate division NC10 bacterium]|jgi:ABC-type nickel/cobalt efflux system permease component RcnA